MGGGPGEGGAPLGSAGGGGARVAGRPGTVRAARAAGRIGSMAGLGRPGPGPRTALPAWKREILERKRAKLAALGGGAAPGPGPAGAVAEPAAERLVLADSLGPLHENPFMRLESERRRGRGRRAGAPGARPAPPPLLELELCVPGLRTIRADNILIIESAPGFAPAPPGRAAAAAAAAEIRAAEVLVFEPAPGRVSRLLEKFDPLSGAAPRAPSPPRRRGSPERTRPPPPAVPKSPPAAAGAPAAPRVGERAAWFERERCGDGASPGARRSDFLQKTGSNSFTVHPRGLNRGSGARPLPNGPAAEPPASSANCLSGAPPGPATSNAAQGAGEWKPKVGSVERPLHAPPSPEIPSATIAMPRASLPASPASATPSQRRWVSAATSANDSFEIRPAPKPDMAAIPEGDLQARALASLRVNSRNSFTFLPKRKTPSACVPEGKQSVEQPKAGQGWAFPPPPHHSSAQLVPGADVRPACQRHPLGAEAVWSVAEGGCPKPATALQDRAPRWPRPSSPPPSLPVATEAEPAQDVHVLSLVRNDREPGYSKLPVTFIDEVDSDEEMTPESKTPPWYRLHPVEPEHPLGLKPHRGNTFMVLPKRKPGPVEELHSGQASGVTQPREVEEEAVGPHSDPGTMLKKRYPAAHEIEVIGGYLALQKSCLTKAGASRKKMKISFNDKSLQTTFEYPSESSLLRSEEEEEEEADSEGSGSESMTGPAAFTLFLPRATLVHSAGSEGSSGESRLGYTAPGRRAGPPGPLTTPFHCSSVQLHSKARSGLQPVAGAESRARTSGGGALPEGSHAHPCQPE
ncbi:taperin isoform X2 [Tenrec ecaudatus]|uniref:taperin isoform X2 n=1 Tax=Tenrec ecaudatus TaxID=94439 RepID=UPI003F5A3ABA